MKKAIVLFGCLAASMAWGRSFSIDLRRPAAQVGVRASAKKTDPSAAAEDSAFLRRVNLDAGCADVGAVAVGDELSFTLFDDVRITLALRKQMPSPLGGDAFLAEASGYEGVKNAVVLRTEDGLTVDVQDYLNKRVYRVISTSTDVKVQEMVADGVRCGCNAREPSNAVEKMPASVSKARNVVAGQNGALDENCVDILVAYDANAATWARANGGGVTNFAQMAVQKMNTVLVNNGLDQFFRFRLVGIETVATSSRDLEYALNASVEGVGDWAPIEAKRYEVGADIVTVLIDTGEAYGTTGLGRSLESINLDYFWEDAYNVCAVRSVALSHTMTHEVGHNMGCGHSDVQETAPGPQLYGYSAGYYFSAAGKKYHTVMAYDNEGPGGVTVPYFSSPLDLYNGVAVGDEKHNNRLTLYNTYKTASKWCEAKGVEIVGDDDDADEDPISRDNFKNARLLTGTRGRSAFTNVGYTKETGEPTHSSGGWPGGASAWASWTAPTTGDWTFWLTGTRAENAFEELDTQLAIYTGTAVGRLKLVVANDDTPDGEYSSRVSFHAQKGVEYKIALDSYRGDAGSMTLRWEEGFVHYVQFEYETMFASAAGGEAEIGVSSSTGWNVVDCSGWIVPRTMSGSDGARLVFSVGPNPAGVERTGTLTLKAGSSEQKSFTIRQHALDFVTTRGAAVDAAWRLNRRILLVMGREACLNTQGTLFNSIPSATVRPLVEAGYVLWYSNCDRQDDSFVYAAGLGSYSLPLVCIIDPQDMSKCVDRVTGYQNESALKSFLDAHADWDGLPPRATYTVTYSPGANGTGAQQTATKTQDVTLTLEGAIFTRTGYTQTGWATKAGGAKAYGLGASYTANASLTLYPFWTRNPDPVKPDPVKPDPVTCYEMLNAGDVVEPYAASKAVTLMGAAYDGCDVAGVVELKLGKVNTKKKSSRVSGSVTTLDGKKHTIQAVNITEVDGTSSKSVSLEVKDFGTMSVTIGGTQFAGSLGKYHVQSANVGGNWTKGGTKVHVDATSASLPAGTLEEFLPDGEPVVAAGGKWKFAKAASIKWAKPKKGAALPEIYDEASGKGLVIDTSAGKTNLSGMKLTYTPKKGTFKGSFKVYALEGEGKAMKLKKYTVNVTGVVVDGVGRGQATCKGPAVGSWRVTVE